MSLKSFLPAFGTLSLFSKKKRRQEGETRLHKSGANSSQEQGILGRIVHYWRNHWEEIRDGGIPVLVRKARSLAIRLPSLTAMGLVSPAVVLIRLLKPFVVIRLGALASDRIGHFAMNTEVYACRRDAGIYPRRSIDIFYHLKPVCNQQLKKMWDRVLFVTPLAEPVDKLNRLIPGYKEYVVPLQEDRDIHGLMARTKPHIDFIPTEEDQAREEFHRLGIEEGTPWVCFHNRDSAYLNRIEPAKDWSYHDCRDASIRNYMQAAKELARRGYFAIRMGSIVAESLPVTGNPRIIDCTGVRRNDFLDIYLPAKCRFFLAGNSGPCAVSEAFRRPIAWANMRILSVDSVNPKDLFIPKHWRLSKEERFLTLREILGSGLTKLDNTEEYAAAGIELVENTPEEIKDLAVEMDERLNGTWRGTDEDEELQERFWSLFKATGPHVISPRIAAGFLRRHPEYVT